MPEKTALEEVYESPFYNYQFCWTVGPYTFFKVQEKIIRGKREIEKCQTLYVFAIDGKLNNESYLSLDSAMAEAIAARHCGTRGAGGTAVDTAAGWFIRMLDSYETDKDR